MRTLPVYYEGKPVAVLEQNAAGFCELTYDDRWMQEGFDISVTLPRTQKHHTGDVVRAFFENMLPESAIREALARHYGVSRENVFGLLSRIGRDCAGAFSLGEAERAGEYREITPAELQDLLETLPAYPMATRHPGTSLSLAGAQDKLPVFRKDGQFYLPLYGAASNCIIKLPMQAFPHSVDNEFFCMQLAHLAGLQTDPADILHLPGMSVLAVGRYDRQGVDFHPRRLAQEDFCQLSGISSAIKYESDGGPTFADCASLIRKYSMQAARDLLRLQQWAAFNLCIGNNDAHAKNISMLRNGARFTLAPFYDLISTTYYGRKLQKKLAMRIGGQQWSHFVSIRRWQAFAADTGLPPATVLKGVASTARAVLSAAPSAAAAAVAAGSPPDIVARLRAHVEARASSVLKQIGQG